MLNKIEKRRPHDLNRMWKYTLIMRLKSLDHKEQEKEEN